MNCPDCATPMVRDDAPPDGGWPQISYRCPVCCPDSLAHTEDDLDTIRTTRDQDNVETKGRL